MKADQDKMPPQKADAPRGELMKCPECGNDTFAMGKSVRYKELRYWRIPIPWGTGGGDCLRAENCRNGDGSYDDFHIVCRKCEAVFWDAEIMEMWEVNGLWD